jgi:hypothetical protein
MVAPVSVSVDSPALRLLAQTSDVDPEKMAAAFNSPEQFFDHMTLEELARLQESCAQLQALSRQLAAALDIYTVHARGFLSGLRGER